MLLALTRSPLPSVVRCRMRCRAELQKVEPRTCKDVCRMDPCPVVTSAWSAGKFVISLHRVARRGSVLDGSHGHPVSTYWKENGSETPDVTSSPCMPLVSLETALVPLHRIPGREWSIRPSLHRRARGFTTADQQNSLSTSMWIRFHTDTVFLS